jgi:1,2-diacylglycerol 3-alpha-glucosyltransferase
MNRKKVGFVFHHIGPYHHARINAVASNYLVAGIEWSEHDNFGWGNCASPARYQKIGLFESAPFGQHNCETLVRRLRRQLEDTACDVLFINGWGDFGSAITIRICVENRIPCVLMSESTQWDGKRTLLKEWIKQRVVGCFSAALVGGTPHADYLQQLGLPKERIRLGYDAVDNQYFAENVLRIRNDSDSVLNGHALPRNFFLASARFIEKKNLATLLKAYAAYRKKVNAEQDIENSAEPWHLVLLGDGELRDSLELLRAELGLKDFVHMPGFKQYPDLPAYYGTAKAFIHASTTEQWGLVVNEAMASGLPVLVSNRCGCARDLVAEGVNGFSFDPEKINDIADRMFQIASLSQDVRLRFGSASSERIANWGPERFARGVKECTEIALEIGLPKCSAVTRSLIRALCRMT